MGYARATFVVAVFSLVGALAATEVSAAPPDREWYEGFYGGAGIGGANGLDLDESTLSEPFDAQGIAIDVFDIDDREFAWHAFVGYEVFQFLAIEGAYTSLGSLSFDAQTPADPGRFSAKFSPTVWSIAGLLTTPPWNGLTAFGKVGAGFWDADLDVSNQLGGGSLAQGGEADGTSLVWGFGVRLDFSKHVGIRAEWERFENVGDTSETGRYDLDAVLGSLVVSF